MTQSGRWQIDNFHMTANEKIPWKRLSAEAAAIVGSILIAFAIDAWWEEQKDRELEQELLASLIVEFEGAGQPSSIFVGQGTNSALREQRNCLR